MQNQLNSNGTQLSKLLHSANTQLDDKNRQERSLEKVHVVGAGKTLTAAYEQLRNAAEYAEEHLLLQRAIRRFYRRLFLLRDNSQIDSSGEEILIELTLAGYIVNDSITDASVTKINNYAREYYDAYESLLKNGYAKRKAEDWTLDVLAVRIEWLFNDPQQQNAYLQFVYEYFLHSKQLEIVFSTKPDDFELSLYVAVQRALIKADHATVRAGLLDRYQQSPSDGDAFVSTNKQIDTLFDSTTTEKLYRYIDRRGAPMRVLRHMIEDDPTIIEKLSNKDEFLNRYESQIRDDYLAIDNKINRGIIKSVIFLIITKVLIGFSIEIPYDYLVLGTIVVLPLVINLLFPPLYMVLLRMTLMLPSPANTQRLVDQMEVILYGSEPKQLQRKSRKFGAGFNVAYVLGFVIVFGGIGLLLINLLEFELLHLFIFFLFLSGASFLGFRLSRMIREVEAVDSDQNAITTARDFLYMPFVIVGRYMSEKYAQVNVVALSLDMFIELPLKTILRLVRQWAAFITSKKDEL